MGASRNVGAQPAFDHGADCFDLPTLTVTAVILVEALFHLSPIAAAGWLLGWTSVQRGDKGADPARLARIAMIGFRIIASVRESGVEKNSAESLVAQFRQVLFHQPMLASYKGGQNKMRGAVGSEFQFRITPVKDGFCRRPIDDVCSKGWRGHRPDQWNRARPVGFCASVCSPA